MLKIKKLKISSPGKHPEITSVLKHALKDLGAEHGSLMVVDNMSQELYITVACSLKENKYLDENVLAGTRIRMGEGISGLVAKTQKPLIINDIKELTKKHPDLVTRTVSSRYRSSIVLPIIEKGKTIAVLNINNKLSGGRFTGDNLKLATMLAKYCAATLKLESRSSELININEIVKEINETNDLNVLFSLIVSKGREIVRCQDVSIMLVEELEGKIRLVVKDSTEKSIIGSFQELGMGVSGWVWKTGEPIIIKDVEATKKDKRFEIINKPGSFIVAPLNVRQYKSPYALNVALKSQSTIGVLNFSNPDSNHPLNEEQLDSIVNYANLCAIAIEKSRFYQKMKSSYLSMVESLAAAIELRDSTNIGHISHVVKYATKLGELANISAEEMEDLNHAAILHDIGKIGIEDYILKKPDKLTPEQYEKIKTHVALSENILRHIPFLKASREIIRHHHERYDGNGYPDKLKGEEIPFGARILIIADAFDAMTSDRVYHKAMNKEDAIKELISVAGTQFDPQFVQLFVKYLENQK